MVKRKKDGVSLPLLSCESSVSVKENTGRTKKKKKEKSKKNLVLQLTGAQLHSTKSDLRFCAGSNLLSVCQRFAIVKISDNGPR